VFADYCSVLLLSVLWDNVEVKEGTCEVVIMSYIITVSQEHNQYLVSPNILHWQHDC